MSPDARTLYSQLRACMDDLVMRIQKYEELEKAVNSPRHDKDRQAAVLSERRLEALFDVMLQSLFNAARNANAVVSLSERAIQTQALTDEHDKPRNPRKGDS
jgi:hypothetical protein